ncbi:MAG: hypothetical protein ACXWPS_10655, partial [Ktedonobacteraceae bacterium]
PLVIQECRGQLPLPGRGVSPLIIIFAGRRPAKKIQNLAFISHTVYTKPRIIETSGRTGTQLGNLHFQIYTIDMKT